jgi:hypothetical protein
MTSKTIKHKGIDITMNVDMEALEKKVITPYKETISTLEKVVAKRNKYISKLHTQLKNKQNLIFGVFASRQIYLATLKDISVKRMMVLSYLYTIDFAKAEKIKVYLNNAGISGGVSAFDMKNLEGNGYISIAGEGPYYYITDKGRQKIEQVSGIFSSSIKYFIDNKKIRNFKGVNKYGISNRKPIKNQEENNIKRRDWYNKMMKPFWESNYKVVPKNNVIRCNILYKWIEKEKSEGREVDIFYVQYLQKWSIKN